KKIYPVRFGAGRDIFVCSSCAVFYIFMFKRSKNITFGENGRTAKILYFISDFWNLAYIAIFAKNRFNRFDPRLSLLLLPYFKPFSKKAVCSSCAVLKK
ncbi:MAG: hypothetical protein KBS39_06265, partial [Lachnospiraceae bacterium]|nr:hypothetical protein [Candidatus Hippenecus merdae]